MAAAGELARGDEAASLLIPDPAGERGRRTGGGRRVVVRVACSGGVVGAGCARASGGSGGAAARRPKLEELLRMEAPTSRADESPDVATLQFDGGGGGSAGESAAALVFDLFSGDDTHDEAAPPPATSKDVPGSEQQQQQQAAVGPPPELGADQQPAAATPTVLLTNVKRIGLVLAARLRATKGPPRRSHLAAGGGANAELFYHRPIALGRRCRVQHMEDHPPSSL